MPLETGSNCVILISMGNEGGPLGLPGGQIKILNFIIDYFRTNHCSPSFREIAHGVGYRSTGALAPELRKLKEGGYIEWMPNCPRTIRVLSKYSAEGLTQADPGPEDIVMAPVLGRISAGPPKTAEQNIASVFQLPALPVGQGDMFLHRMRDDSMREAMILSGDWVVVRKQDAARHGQTVVARISDEETVRVLRHRGRRWLEPCNADYVRTLADEASLLGVVVAVMRSIGPRGLR